MVVIPELGSGFLHNRVTDLECVTRTLLGLTPATWQYRVHLWGTSIHRVRPPFSEESFVSTNPQLDSRFLTTPQPILNPSPERRWG